MRQLTLILGILIFCAACTTTKFEVQGKNENLPLCENAVSKSAVHVFWRPRWRTNQKNISAREIAAGEGIQNFFRGHHCLSPGVIQLVDNGFNPNTIPSILSTEAATDYGIYIEVHELGPVVKIFGSWALLEGGTEVIARIAVYRRGAAQATSDLVLHWKNGGPWVVKGVKSLAKDMRSALRVLDTRSSPKNPENKMQ